MSHSRLANLVKDLTKARQQGLLIEVLQPDLDSWADQTSDVFRTVCDASASVFDANVDGGKTNVLVVGEEGGEKPSSIFGALLGSLDNEFDDLNKREILRALSAVGFGQAVGGAVGDTLADTLNIGAERMMEYVAEWIVAADYVVSGVERANEMAADQCADLLAGLGEKGAEAVAGRFPSESELYLTRPARKRLKKLAPRLRETATSHETLQLALEMLLVTAHDAPKVILVKDPLCLDDASLALLAMLVSLEKDLRQTPFTENAQEMDKSRLQTAGVSVVLTFTGIQPHEKVDQEDLEERQRAISRLRMMASRYSLLERLDSDIPVPAVRSSTFVGREKELESLWRDWNALSQLDAPAKQSWCLVRGEPGTGKTALANRFIQQLHSDAGNPGRLAIPTLRMLNQTGHSAQATGLSSLKHSMAEELRRLSLIYRENVSWFSRFGQTFKESSRELIEDVSSDHPEARRRTLERAGRLVAKLSGVDAVVDVARNAKAWSDQDEMLSMRQKEFGESSTVSYKEEQYELLRQGLREIHALAGECTPSKEDGVRAKTSPLLLLVDDLQWVDDFTAEFLLNEWPAELPIFLIATARPSDSFSITGSSETPQIMNKNRSQLFACLGLLAANSDDLSAEQEQKSNLLLTRQVELRGIDQSTLANLIAQTYVGITWEQADQFATGIIRNLSSVDGATEVNTLFAVETLNVISDSQFYRRNLDLPRLIEPLEGADRYCFRGPQDVGLAEALNSIFSTLMQTYQASYLIEATQEGQSHRFNLASYAVLEERLHLIEQYFGEYGGSARYSLLFSALLGSPFRSGLVQHVLEDLEQISPKEQPALAPFLEEFQKQVRGNLEPAQYELLERAYEIIRRLEESNNAGSRYVHQHGLLQHFLRGQFTQLLNRLYSGPKDFEKGIQALINQIEAKGTQWFDELEDVDNRNRTADGTLEIERHRFWVALSGYWYGQMRALTPEVGEWGERYAFSLNGLAYTLTEWGRAEEALSLSQEALSIRRLGYESSPGRWAEAFASSLNNLGGILYALGRAEEALSLFREALSIRRLGYESSPGRWAEAFASSLNNLGGILYALGRAEEALSLFREALSIRRRGYESSPGRWAKGFSQSLNNLGGTLNKVGRAEEALLLEQEALSLCRREYELSPECWAEGYSQSLNNLGGSLNKLGRAEEALSLEQEALSLCRRGYESSPERWAEGYARSLNSLAFTLHKLGRADKALSLEQEALSLCRRGYESSPERWAEAYAQGLNNLAFTLDKLGRAEEALSLFQEALSIHRLGYESSPGRWAEGYAQSLDNLGTTLYKLGRAEEALSLEQEALSIRRRGYESSPERWAEGYAQSLNNLGGTLYALGRAEEALSLFQEALSIPRRGYESSPERWGEAYAQSLNNLAFILNNLGRAEEALSLEQEALSLCRRGYESSPERWAEAYAQSLNNLAFALDNLGRAEEALSLFQEAVSIYRRGYESSPERWAEAYALSLNNLGGTLYALGRAEEALSLEQEALSLCRRGYESSPERWAEGYAQSLDNLRRALYALGRAEEALSLEQEAVSIYRRGYESSPERWAEAYALSLNNLGGTLYALGRAEEALLPEQEAVSIYRREYELSPEHWAEDYARSLSSLALTLDKLARAEEALLLEQEALSLCRRGYESSPERWAEAYAQSLSNLGGTLYALGRPEEALSLFQEVLSLCRGGYESSPEHWAEGYAQSLNNLAFILNKLGRAEEALSLEQEARSI